MAAQGLFPFPFLVWLARAHNYLALCLQQSGIPPARDGKLKGFILLWEETLNSDIAEVQKGAIYHFMIPKSRHCLPAVPICPPARHKGYS